MHRQRLKKTHGNRSNAFHLNAKKGSRKNKTIRGFLNQKLNRSQGILGFLNFIDENDGIVFDLLWSQRRNSKHERFGVRRGIESLFRQLVLKQIELDVVDVLGLQKIANSRCLSYLSSPVVFPTCLAPSKSKAEEEVSYHFLISARIFLLNTAVIFFPKNEYLHFSNFL